ncbi:MAG TPA: hypothetical protein PLQ19_01500 [Aeromicrobium sp.]|nr:hypothetical protein [Aeromicrobium sp.]
MNRYKWDAVFSVCAYAASMLVVAVALTIGARTWESAAGDTALITLQYLVPIIAFWLGVPMLIASTVTLFLRSESASRKGQFVSALAHLPSVLLLTFYVTGMDRTVPGSAYSIVGFTLGIIIQLGWIAFSAKEFLRAPTSVNSSYSG